MIIRTIGCPDFNQRVWGTRGSRPNSCYRLKVRRPKVKRLGPIVFNDPVSMSMILRTKLNSELKKLLLRTGGTRKQSFFFLILCKRKTKRTNITPAYLLPYHSLRSIKIPELHIQVQPCVYLSLNLNLHVKGSTYFATSAPCVNIGLLRVNWIASTQSLHVYTWVRLV